MESAALKDCFDELATEARELYLDSTVPFLEGTPSSIDFLRDWVMPNKPVVFQNATWSAHSKWPNHDYLRQVVGREEISVSVTPNGYADAICENKFVMPEERRMQFSKFLDIMENRENYSGIFYVQKQNSNFTEEFQCLMNDAERHIPWATEAFGKQPDAVNFWMGDSRAITSMHKDPYENLYCVIDGAKTFALIPPTDQPFVPYEDYPAAVYKETTEGHFEIINDPDTGSVPWIAVDPLDPDLEKYPQFTKARPLTVTVKAGEMLYLPSLWFHHVQQTHGCIAVNFWYDMEYDIKYNYFKFVENLVKSTRE